MLTQESLLLKWPVSQPQLRARSCNQNLSTLNICSEMEELELKCRDQEKSEGALQTKLF